MLNDYSDIIGRIPEPPRWWFRGVPRYAEFHPSLVRHGDGEVALVQTRCQKCGHPFDICVSGPGKHWTLRDRIDVDASFGIGDPPNVGCCVIGMHFHVEELGIKEFWERRDSVWERVLELEVSLWDAPDANILSVEEILNSKGMLDEWFTAWREFNPPAIYRLVRIAGIRRSRAKEIVTNWSIAAEDVERAKIGQTPWNMVRFAREPYIQI